ncbi:MAG: YfjI family protein [Acidobacteriaceae bacterium]
MSNQSIPEGLAGIFPPSDPLHNMSAEKIARLLNIEPSPAASNPAVASDGWPELPNPALHGLAGDVVRAIEPHSEADPAAIIMQFLTAFGNIIGPGPHCRVESSRHSLNLFCVLTGESSKARKGTSWGHIRHIFERVDSGWTADRVTGGLSSAEGLINEVRDEANGDALTDKRLMVVQDEFASVLRIMGREGNNLSPVLRSAWDSGTLRTLVKHDPLKATGAHISMIGHITRPELRKYLSETESHNGFANRLLWACVKRSKCLPEGGAVSGNVIAQVSERIAVAVRWARNEPRELRRDDAARQLWAAVYPKLSDGLPGLLGAATSRAEAQVLRLSGLYAVLQESAVIRVEHLTAALALWDYCYASARFIFGDATGDAVADRIHEALEIAGAEGLSRTGIRDIFKRNVSAERIEQALAQLATLRRAESFTVPTEGRSIEMWRLTHETT